MPRRPTRHAMPLLLAATLALLGGCGPGKDQFAPACPTAAFVPDGADLNRYRDESAAASQDIRDLVLSARISAIPARCQAGDKPTQLAADVGITLQVTRGPAMQGRTADVPFFLAITEGEQIYTEKAFAAHIVFPENVDQVTWSSDAVHMVFPISATKSGAAYTVWAGLQLTREELDYNRSHARLGP